ncbi:MAG: hypothetical protein J6V97_04425 [Prevotella sp.]|nr:hypothetical protein [Prevotella sp.]
MKRPQNIIAESGLTLPVAALFSVVVWLLVGLVRLQLWPQLACFIATIYMVVEMTNQNALLRIRSRMVSSTFIVLSCASCFLFPQMTGGVAQLCMVAAFLMLFQTYQTSRYMGRIFYAFAAIGLGSLAFVQMLWYVPVLWLLMATQLQSMNWRTWLASMLGLAMPYWFALVWFLLPFNLSADWTADLSPLADHFALLADISRPSIPTPPYLLGSILALVLTLVLGAIGITHFWQYSFEDKIRIRLLYGFFTAMTAFTVFLILVQPQHFDVLMRLLTLCACPLIAHVLTFTSSRLSNILFFVALGLALALTVFNLIGNV